MKDHGDSLGRAGSYVLGLMDDEERRRAERDLETDPAFRDAVLEAGRRMSVLDRAGQPAIRAGDAWRDLRSRLGDLPQMRRPAPGTPAAAEPPVTFGRRRTDFRPAPPRRTTQHVPPQPFQPGPHWRTAIAVACLIATFALGYAAGIYVASSPPPAATATR